MLNLNEIKNDNNLVVLRVEDDSLSCPPLPALFFRPGQSAQDSAPESLGVVQVQLADALLSPYLLICLVRALEEAKLVRSASNLLRTIGSASPYWSGLVDELFHELDILGNRLVLQRFEQFKRDSSWCDTLYICTFFGSPRITSTRMLNHSSITFLLEHEVMDSEWASRLANGERFCSRSGELENGFQAYKAIDELVHDSSWADSTHRIDWGLIISKLVGIPSFRDIGLELEKARRAISFVN